MGCRMSITKFHYNVCYSSPGNVRIVSSHKTELRIITTENNNHILCSFFPPIITALILAIYWCSLLEFHLVTSSANTSQFSMHYIRRIRDFTKSTRAWVPIPAGMKYLLLNAHWFSKPQGLRDGRVKLINNLQFVPT